MKTTYIGWYVAGLLCLLAGCRKDYEAPVPYTFTNANGAGRFTPSVRSAMEGVYTLSEGRDAFGEQVVLKWTYVHTGSDTTHYLSILTEKEVGYFNLENNLKSDSLVLNGYWRKLVNTATGQAQLTLKVKRNNQLQAYTLPLAETDTLVLTGRFGFDKGPPILPLTLTYKRPLNKRPFAILAHRSGGRTSDLLPASENTVEIIKLASRLGATGVEMDVRYTKDGVPVLYHDNTINMRLVKKNGLGGALEDYTYQQLVSMMQLINGEKIPTLEEALATVVSNTDLNFVWLDTKYIGPMAPVQAIQQRYIQKAKQLGRNLKIVTGLPSEDAVKEYEALADKSNTPILCELDTAITQRLKANYWAPRWTLGPQTDEVKAMQAKGLTVFVWTLDEPKFIQQFIQENTFDGILSNYSSLVAYYHYSQP